MMKSPALLLMKIIILLLDSISWGSLSQCNHLISDNGKNSSITQSG
jgi:hypothetical protein